MVPKEGVQNVVEKGQLLKFKIPISDFKYKERLDTIMNVTKNNYLLIRGKYVRVEYTSVLTSEIANAAGSGRNTRFKMNLTLYQSYCYFIIIQRVI